MILVRKKSIVLIIFVLFLILLSNVAYCGLFEKDLRNIWLGKGEKVYLGTDFKIDKQGFVREYDLELNYDSEYTLDLLFWRDDFSTVKINVDGSPILTFNGIIRVSFLNDGVVVGQTDITEFWGLGGDDIGKKHYWSTGLMAFDFPILGKYVKNLKIRLEVVKADPSWKDTFRVRCVTFPYDHAKRFPLEQINLSK